MNFNYIKNAKEKQFEIMENWFFENFEDPVENTPYDTKEGGYMYIWGGPYDAYEVLLEEFEDVFPEGIILEFAEKVSEDCIEWERVPTEEDFKFDLEYITEPDISPFKTYSKAMGEVKKLMEVNINEELKEAYYSMLFIKCITIIETYLADRFIFEVLNNKEIFKVFFKENKEFDKRTFKLSEIHSKYESLEEIAKDYLRGLMWHNLAKINKLYGDILDIDFSTYLQPLAKDIFKRHDLVHRNGKDKEGKIIEVTLENLVTLVTNVENFCKFIESENKLKSSYSFH